MAVKKIIIVGSSSGLGKELAVIYAQQNHTVAITGRRHDLLEELKTKYPNNIITSAFDVTASNNQTTNKISNTKFRGP
jgi:NADP-dependent 3-hydroxy acid dehydrogenase YdfG